MNNRFYYYWLWTALFACVAGLSYANDSWALSQVALRVFVAGIVIYLVVLAARDFQALLEPMQIFWVGVIYTILLNPTMGSLEIESIPEPIRTKALFLVSLFILFVMVGYGFNFHRGRRVGSYLSQKMPDFSKGMLLGIIWLVFTLELVRRLYFVDWDFGGMISDMLKGRSGEVRYGRGQFGDWKVILQPISILADWLPCVVAFYWAKEERSALRVLSLIPAALILISTFFGGSRGALATPIAAFLVFRLANASVRESRRYLVAGVLLAFLLAPLMDLMVKYRNRGWSGGVDVTSLVGNPLSAQRDTNFEAFADLVRVVPEQQGFRSPLELYYFTAIAPIPRFLWPEKPYMSQEYLGNARKDYASISIVGDLYFYGGWLHIVFGGYVFGFAVRYLQKFFPLARTRPELTLFYVLNLITMVWTLRALWSLVTALVIQVCFFALLFSLSVAKKMAFSRRLRRAAKRSYQ